MPSPSPSQIDDATSVVHVFWAGGFLILGVLSGAFGAHAVKDTLDADGIRAFETASRYLLFMGSSVLAASALGRKKGLGWVCWGTALFSGSIFLLLALKSAGLSYRWLGPVTPVGGTLLIVGWLRWLWGWRRQRG